MTTRQTSNATDGRRSLATLSADIYRAQPTRHLDVVSLNHMLAVACCGSLRQQLSELGANIFRTSSIAFVIQSSEQRAGSGMTNARAQKHHWLSHIRMAAGLIVLATLALFDWPSAVGLQLIPQAQGAGASEQAQPAGKPVVIPTTGHSSAVKSIAFSPDGRWLVSASYDTTAKVWDIASGRLLRTLPGHTSLVLAVAVAPDGRKIVSSGGKALKIWDAETGQLQRTVVNDSDAKTVIFSRDGRSFFR